MSDQISKHAVEASDWFRLQQLAPYFHFMPGSALDISTQKACQRAIDSARPEIVAEAIKELRARFTAPIVCICGSTKFKQSWITENARLTGEGQIVLAVGLWGHHEQVYPSVEQKIELDRIHKCKIDLCDWVWVLDVGGYIGESTRSEIKYARTLGRPVRYLSNEFPAYVEPVDPLRACTRKEGDT